MEDTTMNQIRKEINNIKEQRELKKLDIVYKYNHELIEFDVETIRLIDDIKSKISARAIF